MLLEASAFCTKLFELAGLLRDNISHSILSASEAESSITLSSSSISSVERVLPLHVAVFLSSLTWFLYSVSYLPLGLQCSVFLASWCWAWQKCFLGSDAEKGGNVIMFLFSLVTLSVI